MSDKLRDLKEYADIAKEILENDTKYLDDKSLISEAFRLKRETRGAVVFRLTIIDSYYSTQMGKRLFGIEDIADKIYDISADDEVLRDKFIKYLLSPGESNEIDNLFISNYGIDKTGKNAGRGASLISKYAYFLTEYRFPIYDRLVKEAYPCINAAYPQLSLDTLSDDCGGEFFKRISELNERSNIKDYDKLDNLLWLYGKIKEGSFSLILSKQVYLRLIPNIDFNGVKKSREKDDRIREYIKRNIKTKLLREVFSKPAIEFIRFCLFET